MDDLIFNQGDIPKEKWRYGLRCSANTGCGWIATYNALRLMEQAAKPEEIIRYYTRQLPLIHGLCGTMLWAPALYFKKHGYSVKLTGNRKRFDDLAKESDVCLLFYWWRNKWKLGAHFVALRHTDRGFVGYNTYKNSTGPDFYGESLANYIKNRKIFCCFLTAIRRKAD